MQASEFDLLNIPKSDRVVVLLQSGGLDSCYLACLLNYYDFTIHHVFIDYGQNSVEKEFDSANKIVNRYGGVMHKVSVKLPWLKESSALNGGVATVYATEDKSSVYLSGVVGNIYVPMRNLMFIGIASSLAEHICTPYIATGLDGLQDREGNPLHGTPDKHPNFVLKLEDALTESSTLHHIHGKNFQILCPIIGNEKVDTIRAGLNIDCNFEDSWTCYNKSDKPCLNCGSCIQRLQAFEELGLMDPSLVKYYGEYPSVEEILRKVGNPIDNGK